MPPDQGGVPVPDVEVGTIVDSGEPLIVSEADRPLGVAMIGVMGKGKSSLMEQFILPDIEHGTPALVIDPHGTLAERVVGLASFPDNVVLLDPSRGPAFGLNLLACREPRDPFDDPVTWAVNSTIGAIQKLYRETDDFQPRFERYLRRAARTLIPSGKTLLDVPWVFQDKAFRDQCLARVPTSGKNWRARLRRAWEEFEQLGRSERSHQTEAVLNRLETLLDSEVIQDIVGSTKTTLPFDELLYGDTVLLLSLPQERLGGERVSNFIGAMVLAAFGDRIFARGAGSAARTVHLYLDEYHRFAIETTAQLLTEGRKFKAGVTLAHQGLSQIKDETIRSASSHANTKVVFTVTDEDAQRLAGAFAPEPRDQQIEILEEPDGFEREEILSRTPLQAVLDGQHSDDAVLEAAEKLTGEETPWGYRVSPDAFDDLLIQAMKGDEPPWQGLLHYLWNRVGDAIILPEQEFKLLVERPFIPVLREEPGRWQPKLNPYDKRDQEEREKWWKRDNENERRTVASRLESAYGTEKKQLRLYFNRWVDLHAQYRPSAWPLISIPADRGWPYLRPDDILMNADRELIDYASSGRWCANRGHAFIWLFPEHLLPPSNVYMPYSAIRKKSTTGQIGQRTARSREEVQSDMQTVLYVNRRRVKFWSYYLGILCEGLARKPIYVQTSNLRPRPPRRHYIVTPQQGEHDARAEFARRLTMTPKYMAHVRSSSGNFQIFTRKPAPDSAVDLAQVQDVRDRSHAAYAADLPTQELAPPADEETPRRAVDFDQSLMMDRVLSPPITRRPPDPPAQPPQEEPTD